MDLQAYWC